MCFSQAIMGENEPSINIADKSINFGRDVCFGILMRKNSTPRFDNQPLTYSGVTKKWGEIYLTFSTLHSVV